MGTILMVTQEMQASKWGCSLWMESGKQSGVLGRESIRGAIKYLLHFASKASWTYFRAALFFYTAYLDINLGKIWLQGALMDLEKLGVVFSPVYYISWTSLVWPEKVPSGNSSGELSLLKKPFSSQPCTEIYLTTPIWSNMKGLFFREQRFYWHSPSNSW